VLVFFVAALSESCYLSIWMKGRFLCKDRFLCKIVNKFIISTQAKTSIRLKLSLVFVTSEILFLAGVEVAQLSGKPGFWFPSAIALQITTFKRSK
jgi:hypothetical protein